MGKTVKRTVHFTLGEGAGKHEKDAEISIQTYNENGSKGWNLSIAEIHLGDIESSNTLAAEIVRRFNEFPEELKR